MLSLWVVDCIRNEKLLYFMFMLLWLQMYRAYLAFIIGFYSSLNLACRKHVEYVFIIVVRWKRGQLSFKVLTSAFADVIKYVLCFNINKN